MIGRQTEREADRQMIMTLQTETHLKPYSLKLFKKVTLPKRRESDKAVKLQSPNYPQVSVPSLSVKQSEQELVSK